MGALPRVLDGCRSAHTSATSKIRGLDIEQAGEIRQGWMLVGKDGC